MNKPHAVRPADQKVLMAFMSQLILCLYATSTIGQNFVMHRDKAPTVRIPIAAGISRDGFMVNGLEEKHEWRCENKNAMDTKSHSIDRILAYHLAFTRTQSILVQLGTLGAFWQS